jgi:hypothetical protein
VSKRSMKGVTCATMNGPQPCSARPARTLIDLYQGDLRGLRTAADSDPAQERKLLDQFKGVGDVAVNIFFREAQRAWPQLFPFADERALATAKELGLPANARELASLVRAAGRIS